MKKYITINNIPAVIWGEQSEQVYLFVHGQFGSKEDAKGFADIVCPKGYQVPSFDLPEHGDRKEERDRLNPWSIVPEMEEIMAYVKDTWNEVSLIGNSLGVYFSLLSYPDIDFKQCLFVSPILDMVCLIHDMMREAGVTLNELEEKKEITLENGIVLSIRYLTYAKDHAIQVWNAPTHIFYAEHDHMTHQSTVNEFVNKFNCELFTLPNGEHWIHTKEQVAALLKWFDEKTR